MHAENERAVGEKKGVGVALVLYADIVRGSAGIWAGGLGGEEGAEGAGALLVGVLV